MTDCSYAAFPTSNDADMGAQRAIRGGAQVAVRGAPLTLAPRNDGTEC